MLFKPHASILLLVAAALVCIVFSPYSSAQSPSGASVATVKSIPVELRRPPTQHELVVPFWTLEPGWDTQIEVRNNLAHGTLAVIPVLRKSDGSEMQAPPVTISSDEIKKLDLQSGPELERAHGRLWFTAAALQLRCGRQRVCGGTGATPGPSHQLPL